MRIEIISGPSAEEIHDVQADSTLGRDPSNRIVVDDIAISLVHCAFFFGESRTFLKDLGSTNGTLLNDKWIVHCEINDGDVITIGDTSMKVSLVREATGTLPRGTVKADQDTAPDAPSVDGDPLDAITSIVGDVSYYLKRKIAEGGMGAIYEAEQLGAEGFIKRMALKTIRAEYARRKSFVSSFIGEAKLVGGLVHQNIVQIYQLGRFEGGYYITMEYIDGIDISHFLFRQGMMGRDVPLSIATYIVSRVCRGLEYAHTKRGEDGTPFELVHRDVSPNNIMITNEGEVKLADFGVAKATIFMEEEDGAYLVGSPQYMSPEQASCRTVDARSDIYSLGLVYYELLTGATAYPATDENETLRRARSGKIEIHPTQLRPDLPEDIEAILVKCLARDPADRYANAGELGYALEYNMYSEGYGPTIVTLANYVAELFPEREFYAPPQRPPAADTTVPNAGPA